MDCISDLYSLLWEAKVQIKHDIVCLKQLEFFVKITTHLLKFL